MIRLEEITIARQEYDALVRLVDDARVMFAALVLSEAYDHLNDAFGQKLTRWQKKASRTRAGDADSPGGAE